MVFFSILGIAVVCAFAGIEPLSSAKNEVASWAHGFTSGIGETLPSATEDLPDEEIPSASEYPADITGHVTMADMVIAKYGADMPKRMHLTPSEDKIWWIVDISVKNVACENAIAASHQDWKIVANDKVYHAQPYLDAIPASYPMSVPLSETGETTFRFLVPDTLKVGDAELCYQRQEASSYGSLSGGDKVALYDWDSRSIVKESYEKYIVEGKQMSLRTIASWRGSECRAIKFDAGRSPWVVNCGCSGVSEIVKGFDVFVVEEATYEGLGGQDIPASSALGAFVGMAWFADDDGCIVIPRAGCFVIVVEASGVEWWVRIGVE